jgi:hypothetical protein
MAENSAVKNKDHVTFHKIVERAKRINKPTIGVSVVTTPFGLKVF